MIGLILIVVAGALATVDVTPMAVWGLALMAWLFAVDHQRDDA